MNINTEFIKKPVIVHAMQYKGDDDLPAICAWVKSFGADYDRLFHWKDGVFGVRTLEDHNYNFHTLRHGDWIVRGVDGEFYPCFAPIFDKLHEKHRVNIFCRTFGHWWSYHVKCISRTCRLCGRIEYQDMGNGTGGYRVYNK